MRNHYIPRLYLKGFADGGTSQIWTYDRISGRKFRASISNVALRKNFYPDELEQRYATSIEAPASAAISKIRSRLEVNDDEKVAMARFIVAQWKRVPSGKRRYWSYLPEVADEIRENVTAQFDRLVDADPSLAEVADKRRVEMDEVIDRYKKSPPDDVWHQSIDPANDENVVRTILALRWRYFCAPPSEQFLTCDNPVFFFPQFGVGNPESEVSYAISSDLALWASRNKELQGPYLNVKSNAVKEFNRRTVSQSERFIFAKRDERWIQSFVAKPAWKLNRIQ